MVEKGALRIKEIFTESQHGSNSHKNLQNQLKTLHSILPAETFFQKFADCLKVVLVCGERAPTVERVLDFAVKFGVSLNSKKTVLEENTPSNDDENEGEEMPPFLLSLFKFLCEHVCVENQVIRFRICQFINKLLNGLGNEASLDDDLCDVLNECLLERLKDKSPTVRTQAVRALYRLQDPTDPACPVTKAYSFHVSCDPSSDVRCTVLTNMAISSHSVRLIVERTRDANPTVRKAAYLRIAELSIQRFSIDQRVRILERGLKDSSEKVRKCVATDLLRSWFDFHKSHYLSFLHALDSENSTDISTLALQTMFKSVKSALTNAIEQLRSLFGPDKLIPVEELSPENVLFLKVVTEYLDAHPEIAEQRPIDEPFEELLPELSSFCSYIRKFFDRRSPDEEPWVHVQRQYILKQLLEISKGFDFGDEMGRANLRTLCLELLLKDSVSDGVVPCLVEVMEKVIPDVDDRLQSLAEVISELRDPLTEAEAEEALAPPVPELSAEEKRQLEIKEAKIRMKLNELTEEQDEAAKAKDFRRAQELEDECQLLRNDLASLNAQPPPPKPVVQESRSDEVVIKDISKLRKCLYIVREMMQSSQVVSLTPTLRSLMHNFVMPSFQQVNGSDIRNLALTAVGIFCLLDVDLAKEHFVYTFCLQIANDEVCETALKVTFDLLHQYGLETFEVEHDNEDESGKKRSKKKKNLFVTETYEDEFEDEDESHRQVSETTKANTANLISMLTSLLSSTSTAIRNLTMEGLCKLLLACRMTSASLLSRLTLMWYSPVTAEDEEFRQTMGAFLTALSTQCPRGQEMLEAAFLPTMRTLREAPADSPLSVVDQESVAKLFLSLTRPGVNRYHKKQSPHVHNAFAISLCNEILNQDDGCTDEGTLLKCLLQLELALDDPVFRKDLMTFARSMKEMFLLRREKSLVKYVDQFKKRIDQSESPDVPAVPDVDNTARTEQLDGTTSSVARKFKKNAKILKKDGGMQEDDGDASVGSPDVSPSRVTHSIVIPESPDSPKRRQSFPEGADAEGGNTVSRSKRRVAEENVAEVTDARNKDKVDEDNDIEEERQSKKSRKEIKQPNAEPEARTRGRPGKRKSVGDEASDKSPQEDAETATTESTAGARKRLAREPTKSTATTVAPKESEATRKRRSVQTGPSEDAAELGKKKAEKSRETEVPQEKPRGKKADKKTAEESAPSLEARPRRELKLTAKAMAYKEDCMKAISPKSPPNSDEGSPVPSQGSRESSASSPTPKRKAVQVRSKSAEQENSSPEETPSTSTTRRQASEKTATAADRDRPKSPVMTRRSIALTSARKSGGSQSPVPIRRAKQTTPATPRATRGTKSAEGDVTEEAPKSKTTQPPSSSEETSSSIPQLPVMGRKTRQSAALSKESKSVASPGSPADSRAARRVQRELGRENTPIREVSSLMTSSRATRSADVPKSSRKTVIAAGKTTAQNSPASASSGSLETLSGAVSSSPKSDVASPEEPANPAVSGRVSRSKALSEDSNTPSRESPSGRSSRSGTDSPSEQTRMRDDSSVRKQTKTPKAPSSSSGNDSEADKSTKAKSDLLRKFLGSVSSRSTPSPPMSTRSSDLPNKLRSRKRL